MISTKDIACELGISQQAVNRAVKKACASHLIDPGSFGTKDPKDKRIRIFSSDEVELILKFAPTPKRSFEPDSESSSESDSDSELDSESLTPIVESGSIAPLAPSGLVLRTAKPLVQFNIQELNVNLLVSSTQSLDQETDRLNRVTAQALNALQQLTSDELQSDINQMRSQNKNAIAAIQAQSVIKAVQSLANQQVQSEVQSDERLEISKPV